VTRRVACIQAVCAARPEVGGAAWTRVAAGGSIKKGFNERSYWIPGSWHLGMSYTEAIPCPTP
jgi:hypothetical protein